MFRRDRKACSTDDMSSKQVLVFKLGLGTVAGFCLWQLDTYIHIYMYIYILYTPGGSPPRPLKTHEIYI